MKKLSYVLSVACCVAAPLLFASSASAQFAKPEAAVDYRESVMTIMSTHFGRLGPTVKGQVPLDAAKVQSDVAIVAMMAKLPWGAFGPGTDGGHARPEVWSDNAKFKQISDEFQANVAKLASAAQSGDLAQIRTAYGDVGESCKTCHDSFRKK